MAINQKLITASQLSNLLEMLYVLVIDYTQTGTTKANAETALEIKSIAPSAISLWGKDLPSLKAAISSSLTGKNKVENLVLLGQEIKQEFQHFRADEKFTSPELETLQALGAYLRTDSEPALKKIQKMAGIADSVFVSKHLAPQVGSQKNTSSILRKMVYDMTGRDATSLTIEEAKQVKDLHPDLYRDYLAYRKEHSQVWKDALVNYVRESGHKLVPYEELLSDLEANGIEHSLPKGFTGLVDDLGRMYTNDGSAIDGVPNAVSFPKIQMNDTYGRPNGGDFVFQAIRPNGGPGPYFYTVGYKKQSAKQKFAKVADLLPKIESMQKEWFTKVKSFNPEDLNCVCAVVLEILYEFSARIGSLGNAAGGTSTYGVSTLLVKHAFVTEQGITLRYKGKDGVSTVHKLLSSDSVQHFVVKDLLQLLENKGPKDRIFTLLKPNGRQVPVSGAQVNTYFTSLGAPEGVTVHKLRTARGTSVFVELTNQLLEKNPPKDEKRALEQFNKIAMEVGKILNHVKRGVSGTKVTGTTALNNYIDPTAQLSYWHQLGFRPPKYLEKFVME